MNYLAHLYLAGNNRGLLIGGFIADAVKGKQIQQYDSEIIRGIRLHREIDSFTDSHPLIERGKVQLRSRFNKFSGIVMDIFGDHFLARNWERYSNDELNVYCQTIYSFLQKEKNLMPEQSQRTLHYMSMQDWLYNYQHIDGIQMALTGLARRSKFESGMETAHMELERSYGFYEDLFNQYIPKLTEFVGNRTQ
jgi:acyl carrier protein phosphodiesterase